ncbi:MAG: NAD(P)/FAD-dependent oxidoreductase [Rhodocyclaceae bacterium]|nr:NAD(P)/FAD-dependent oxidoreductase [Rhodocyclaceae bacterium]MCA3024644.1 NAD(P)/FAD-dependent oxidoreductase [Rhodocyclaceae bacterium]MCA3031657.1 NAD(P)/FAD-dependent oxidoreductase [Rhodocyclaceae bacterium]MCA3037437.1 NAD(P)/FAD-dependent oxidoreductase [Rhodocyclaceae bacterium]MCA3047543.1 NAD(P)/FAD-dependent oxidoreductase [Rhodocyclaceae bacterium]
MKPNHFDAIVVGAGAAGMMCAATAGKRGARVLLVDHYHKLGEKIRISGGGRCNFTNLHTTPANFLSQNPHYCRSALARYAPNDFIKLVESHQIKYHEKTLGQLFCDDSAVQIIQMLKTECDRAHVSWRMPVQVSSIKAVSSGYEVRIGDEWMSCTALVIATGGLAVPKIGATPFGYQVAEQFGLAIIPPKPALVPLAFEPESLAKFGDLSGISLDATVSCGDGEFREAVLLTHRGLSGPAILQISSYWQAGSAKDPIHVNVLPGAQPAALKDKRQSKAQLHNLLAEVLPRRFADSWCLAHQLTKPANELSDSAFNTVLEQLRDWRIKPSGTLGYNKAEVTLGGVDTRTLSSKTMAVTNQPNLYFIGEVVDVTGHLGGFNFQWAWASGHAAGIAIAERRA